MNDSEYQMLLVESWRRGLTPGEKARLQAFLAEQPERAADWERETALNDALNRLPDAPVASNFAALVMRAVERESKCTEPQAGDSFGWLARWLRRPASGLAWAAALALLAWSGYEQFYGRPHRERAMELSLIMKAVAPEAGVFQDFDAIQRLPAADDEELYAVLNVSH